MLQNKGTELERQLQSRKASEEHLQELLRQMGRELEIALQQNEALSSSSRKLLEAEQSNSAQLVELQKQLETKTSEVHVLCPHHLLNAYDPGRRAYGTVNKG